MLKGALKHAYKKAPFKRHIFAALRPLSLPRALTARMTFSGVVTIPIGRSVMRMNNDHYWAESDLFWSGFGNGWEGTSLQIWARLASSASFVIDIGSNTGIYCLAAKAVNPTATVVAFEPLERVHKLLAQNLRLNDLSVRAEDLAVSDHNGTALLFEDRNDHTLASVEMFEGRIVHPETHVVTTTRLDSYLDGHGGDFPDLIKVDVEGHEAAVIRGMGVYLSRTPTILIELLSESVATQVEALARTVDYRFLHVHEREGVSQVQHLVAGRSNQRNFVLCNSRIAEALMTTFGRNAPV